MPLYTIWQTGTAEELIADVLVCTAADLLIAIVSLAAGIILTGWNKRRASPSPEVIFVTCLVAVSFTIFSEWINVHVTGTWAYSDLMPIVPGLKVGLSPLVQWVILPSLGILLAERCSRRARKRRVLSDA
jgi:hypothetical protein